MFPLEQQPVPSGSLACVEWYASRGVWKRLQCVQMLAW